MAITLESLNKNKAELVAQKEQMLANLNAVGGAIQLVDSLIKQETEAAVPVVPEVPAPPAVVV